LTHKKSELNRQKKDAQELLRILNHRDFVLAETIHTIKPEAIFKIMKKRYNVVFDEIGEYVCLQLDRHELGEVRSDSRGRGTCQQRIFMSFRGSFQK